MRGVRALDPGADRSRNAQGAAVAGGADCNARADEDEGESSDKSLPVRPRASGQPGQQTRTLQASLDSRLRGNERCVWLLCDINDRPLRLPLRHAHHQAVELLGHLDLAVEPRARPHVVAEVEHVLLHRRGTAGALAPGVVDIDMAGCAGTAALGLDAGHVFLDRGFHPGRAELAFDLVGSAVRTDVGDLGHGRTHMVRLPAERRAASYNDLWRDAPDRPNDLGSIGAL